MPTEILMPALSPTMTEGNLAKWLKQVGDKVEPGDVIAEIETDKATMEVEAIDEGTLGRILIDEGTEGVLVNTPIAVLLGDGEDANAVETATPSAPTSEARPAEVPDSAAAAPAMAVHVSAVVPDDPELPAGTEMATQTVREALRDAMAEEMRADDRVFLMGEEVAEYQGAYKVSQGLLDEFGSKPRDRYADHRAWLCRHRASGRPWPGFGRSSSS